MSQKGDQRVKNPPIDVDSLAEYVGISTHTIYRWSVNGVYRS